MRGGQPFGAFTMQRSSIGPAGAQEASMYKQWHQGQMRITGRDASHFNSSSWKKVRFHSICHLSVRILLAACFLIFVFEQVRADPAKSASGFQVKHIYHGSVYLDGGSTAGLSTGQRLIVTRSPSGEDAGEPEIIGEIEIDSVAPRSAAGSIVSSDLEIIPGDRAYFKQEDLQQLNLQMAALELKKYPQLVSFTEGSPPDQEVRENLPAPPLPEVNRIRGRIGIDSSSLRIPGTSGSSSQFGFILRLDANRLAGTHWSASGYHRGRLQSTTTATHDQTLRDLINRTYHLRLTYDNPDSHWVAGVGRLLVPWASSLNTLDGGYLGWRYGKETVGIFAGTSPDPSSWNYNSDRQTGGVFVNTERGSFEAMRFSSTAGLALSRVHWQPDRQFGFFENSIFYKHYFSFYSDVEADLLTGAQTSAGREAVLSRSYTTVRLQPHKIVSFDVSDNYFRNTPTFDTRLIGTGLLDKYLFQGVNGGMRLLLPYRVSIYSNAGRSSRTGDQNASWNYLYGGSISNIKQTGIRVEYRHSRFDSSFGRGNYQSLTFTRELKDTLRFDLQFGQQDLHSMFSSQSRSRFLSGNIDCYLGTHYFLGGSVTVYRGQVQDYNQYFINLGYRFDNRRR
jgi:hypothetical protein